MKKRTYSPIEHQTNMPAAPGALALDRPIAVYYRQSTDAQIGNISTTMQTVDMVRHLKDRGWSDEQIIMIDMDGGISGTTKIDERPGMRKLFDLITDEAIGTVACQDEDRLFRDVTQIQVNIFIEACRNSGTQVMTPTMVYDFAHPQMGTFHARQFRFKSEMSAEFISAYLKGRLHPAKKRMMMDGLWAGWSVPLGYLVDTRKKLADDTKNPNWRKYVPYEPFAEIIREYFRIFLANAGNMSATVKHIYQHGPYYPDPNNTVVPDGMKFAPSYRLKNYGTGYCLGDNGMYGIFTNAAYIGHWMVNGSIVRWNNHPAILDENTFFQAFNYLSAVTLDGQPNPSYNPYQQNGRPSLEEHRPVERPLLSGLIFTEIEGKRKRATTNYRGREKYYAYCVSNPYPVESLIWWRKAEYIDDLVIGIIKQKLEATFQDEHWQATLDDFSSEFERERRFKQKQIETLEQTMNNLLLSLENLTHPTMIARVQERYTEAEREHKRLANDIADAQREIRQFEAIKQLRSVCTPALEQWDSMARGEQLNVVQSLIRYILIARLERHTLNIEIHWRDGTSDQAVLCRKGTTYKTWTVADEIKLLSLIDRGVSQEELCAQFSQRTWEAIRQKVWSIRGRGSVQVTPLPISDNETYLDYINRTKLRDEIYKARSGERWNGKSLALLERLVEHGATQIEIAAAFPHRNWGRIRAKITKEFGNVVAIPDTAKLNGSAGKIRKYETYEMYLLRQQRLEHEAATDKKATRNQANLPSGSGESDMLATKEANNQNVKRIGSLNLISIQ